MEKAMRVLASTVGPRNLLLRVSCAARRAALVSLLVALVGGCGQDSPAAESPTEAPSQNAVKAGANKPPEDQPAAEKPAVEKPGKEALASNFALRMHAEADYEMGKLAQFSVSLVPAEGWKVNQEYPMSVEIESPEGLGVMTAKMGKGDAAAFDTHQARFDIPFTPAAVGEHEIVATVNFAVCTAETCVPDQRKLAVAVHVAE